ncbi:restriction endonuclease subunit S [Pseudoalteromonas sp. L23]|uniref:restriction endonuclease subunit S n=1 Tax=unclassified Pseudoalteromonas TaxID=194690 RepID=UPI001EEF96FA|nr:MULTISPECIES: restriction endonuclease subunit S [unclassified Pseudoalteromonas]MCF7514077.1 restriction endonuclease subunit S [Pseudoalteromonas sp. L7]MCF7526169.1 restriction endonuclease subunit S [Pseudoalteromonas sp. L23]
MSLSASKPKVRFKEFEEDWKPVQLSELLSPSKKKNKNSKFARNDVLSVTQEYGLVNQIEYLGRSFAGKDLTNYGVAEVGDIVYTKSPLKTAPYGIIKENTFKDGIVSTLYAVYKVREKVDGGFVSRYFELTDNLNRYLRPLVHKGAKNDMKISAERVLIDQIFTPSIDEQLKIRDFFQSFDKYIGLLEKRCELLHQRRKSIVQKVFKKEVRFKDIKGNEYPCWSPNKLEMFLKESRCTGTKGDKAKKLTVKLWGKGVVEKTKTHEGSENTQYYRRRAGQFIYSKLDFLNCAFGVIPDKLDNFESTVDLPCFDIKKELNPLFLLEYVKRQEFYKKFGSLADGGRKAKRVHADTFLQFVIHVPALEEQNKIVNLFQVLDRQLASEEKKLSMMRTLKKSFLQQMFV